MSSTRTQVLHLYKQFHKYANRWQHYGFRNYTKIRARDAFKQHKSEKDPQVIQNLVEEAQKNLGIWYYAIKKYKCD